MSSRRSELESNLRAVEDEVRSYKPTLIVVTKTYPISDVLILSELGVRDFGENRSSEGVEKSVAMAASGVNLNWHYQGEIQSKKLREITSWARLIHSLDSAEHGIKLNRTLEDRNIETFIQLSLDGDSSRGGVVEGELFALAEAVAQLPQVNLMGIMCVPPVSMAPEAAFKKVGAIHQRFRAEFPDSPFLSAGMSGDYLQALDHGATHIRIGSKILGSRQYH